MYFATSAADHPAAPLDQSRLAGLLGPFRKHLDGAYSLPRTYWLHLVAGSQLFLLLDTALTRGLAHIGTTRASAVYTIVAIVLNFAWWLYLAIGTWASADRHVARGGRRGWATTTRVVLLLTGIRMLFAVPASVVEVREQWPTAAGQQLGPAPVFYLSADAKSLTVYGGINDGTAAALEERLARAPGVTTIVLDSTGGWVREGQRIGALIASRGLNTHVESVCASACTIAFLNGKTRSLRPGARLGFHNFASLNGTADEMTMREAYVRLRMGSEFIDKVARVSPSLVWYPQPEELIQYRILTQPPGQATPSLAGFLTQL